MRAFFSFIYKYSLYLQWSFYLSGNAPKLKPFAFDRNVISGQRARVFCQLLEGITPLSFRWSKDGHQLKSVGSESMEYSIEDHEDYSSLVIDPVSGRNSGNYSCLVSNSYGSDTYSSVLIVQGISHSPPYC